MRIKPSFELKKNEFVVNQIFHKLLALKSVQDVRSKDFIQDTVLKVSGDIKHEEILELARLLKDQELINDIEQIHSHHKKLLAKLDLPRRLFRRRIMVDQNNPQKTESNIDKGDEDKSHLTIKYPKNDVIDFEPIKTSRKALVKLKDLELPKFRRSGSQNKDSQK